MEAKFEQEKKRKIAEKSVLLEKKAEKKSGIEDKLSHLLFDCYRKNYVALNLSLPHPINDEQKLFPLDVNAFVTALLPPITNKFWKGFIAIIGNIAATTIRGQYGFKEETKDLVEDICETFLNCIQKESYLLFDNASHLKNLLFHIAKCKKGEFLRLQKKFPRAAINEIENIPDYPEATYPNWNKQIVLDEIDCTNRSEMEKAMGAILFNPMHPLHAKLTQGQEEKIEILLHLEINGLSYEEILEKKYLNFSSFSEEEKKRLYENMRQEMCRLKKRLKKNLEQMILDAQKKEKNMSQKRFFVN